MTECLPIPIVFVDENQRLVYKELYADLTRRLMNLGKLTQRVLSILEWGRNDYEPAQIRLLYNRWLETFITDEPTLNEMKRYDDELQINMNASVFCELSRLHLILHFNELDSGTTALVDGDNNAAGMTGWTLNNTTSTLWTNMPMPDNLDWDKRVFAYTQSEVMSAIMFLTSIMDDLASPQLEHGEGTLEFIEYFNALYTRNAIFFCQKSFPADILDVEEMIEVTGEEYRVNFDYYIWCSFYFGVILRRIFYYDEIKYNTIEPPIRVERKEIEKCQQWVKHLCDLLGQDSCEEIYRTTCEDCYRIPGDENWFKYRYEAQPATATILNKLRIDLEKRFWEESNVSIDSVISLSKQTAPQFMMRSSWAFVLNVIDSFMRSSQGISWRGGATVAQTEIELSQWKLSRKTCPLVFQVFSRWWVYNGCFYQPSDSIYETLVLWMRILKEEYEGKLFDMPMHEICEKILL